MNFIKSLYIHERFYLYISCIASIFLVSFWFPILYSLAWLLVTILGVLLLSDAYVIYKIKNGIIARRILTEKFSNSDENPVAITVKNNYKFKVEIKLIDELPFQFQKRDFEYNCTLQPNENYNFEYEVKPVERGEYHFGKLNIYISSPLQLLSKRYSFNQDEMVPTYPSYIQLRKYDLIAFSNNLFQYGMKKIRRIGHTMEFEQIKEYVLGDDLRTINWKATAKKNSLMVNQFQDEKSQPIYTIIDKGRVMQMPFNGLSLLDYAINSALVISNIVLKKHDKAGLFSFSKKVENVVFAERRSSQMRLILEALYNIKTDFFESDFSRLYGEVKRNITHRSLIFLYTNFETLDGLHRQLPYLKAMAKGHLIVVIFFKNTELDQLITNKAQNIKQVYDKAIAEKFAFEKRLIVNELKKYGIYSILTTPENLTLDTINKYLEIKARGLL